MIRRFLGGAALTAAATALLFFTVTAGTANAAVGNIIVAQLNGSLLPIPGCPTKNHSVHNSTPLTIHDSQCAGAVFVSITTTTLQPITVHTDYAVLTMLGTTTTLIGPHGIDIDVPGGGLL